MLIQLNEYAYGYILRTGTRLKLGCVISYDGISSPEYLLGDIALSFYLIVAQ